MSRSLHPDLDLGLLPAIKAASLNPISFFAKSGSDLLPLEGEDSISVSSPLLACIAIAGLVLDPIGDIELRLNACKGFCPSLVITVDPPEPLPDARKRVSLFFALIRNALASTSPRGGLGLNAELHACLEGNLIDVIRPNFSDIRGLCFQTTSSDKVPIPGYTYQESVLERMTLLLGELSGYVSDYSIPNLSGDPAVLFTPGSEYVSRWANHVLTTRSVLSSAEQAHLLALASGPIYYHSYGMIFNPGNRLSSADTPSLNTSDWINFPTGDTSHLHVVLDLKGKFLDSLEEDDFQFLPASSFSTIAKGFYVPTKTDKG